MRISFKDNPRWQIHKDLFKDNRLSIMKKKPLQYLAITPAACLASSMALASSLNMELGADLYYFPNENDVATQGDYSSDSAVTAGIEYDNEFYDGTVKVMVDANARYNHRDDRRSRGDFNELAVGYFNEHMDITAGILTEFWGVTESRHLVDILNQTNVAENIDEEVKLGQPMMKTQFHHDWGNVQLYWLPVFRERIYPGNEARLSPGDTINYRDAQYESSDEEHHQDFAIRYTKTLEAWDIGIAHFSGTSREPLLIPDFTQFPAIVLTPYYEQIEQSSIDVQMTSDSLLLKLEAISRTSELQKTYQSAVVGFEYTQVGVFDSAMDLGYIAEYLYDERDEEATTPFADDVFAGLRLIQNNIAQTTYLLGVYVDAESHSNAWRFEMDTRLQDGLTLSLEGQAFANQPQDDLLYGFRNDDYVKVGLEWFF